MTDPTLTSDRLDELEGHARRTAGTPGMDNHIVVLAPDMLALIAQAMRADAAERERDALREQVKILKDGILGILQCGYNQFDQNQTCPLCNGARHDHKDSDCLLSIVDRTMIDFAWCETAALAEPTDGGEA